MFSISRIKESLRYDANHLKGIFIPFLYLANRYFARKPKAQYLNFLSSLFRLSWPGTYAIALAAVRKSYLTENNNRLSTHAFQDMLNNIENLERYKKFIDKPETMLDGIITVMAPYKEGKKGVLVIAYSYYFLIFLKTLDFEKIEKRYHIVLEPSWNGLCEQAILGFTYLSSPVFVMAYEDRDFNFLSDLKSNLVPVRLSANWWIDPDTFNHGVAAEERDIDIIMIAAWAKFKRHNEFFKTLSLLKQSGQNYRVTLVGYPNDLTQQDIQMLAKEYKVLDMLTFYEWIPAVEVARLVGRAKVNIIWSRFEGLNRAIIEGMFCDTPCILREGFNFGMKYPYINPKTGRYANESNLHHILRDMIANPTQFEPREYILEHHNCHKATEVLAESIKDADPGFNPTELVPKTSELNGMKYLSQADHAKMQADYTFLAQAIRNEQHTS